MSEGEVGRPATGRNPTLKFTVPEWLEEKVKEFAANEFAEVPATCRRLLEAGLATNGVAPAPITAAERQKIATAGLKELEFAKKRLETLTIDQVLAFYEKELTTFKSRLAAIPQQVFGLSPEQSTELKRALDDACADFAGTEEETWKNVQRES